MAVRANRWADASLEEFDANGDYNVDSGNRDAGDLSALFATRCKMTVSRVSPSE